VAPQPWDKASDARTDLSEMFRSHKARSSRDSAARQQDHHSLASDKVASGKDVRSPVSHLRRSGGSLLSQPARVLPTLISPEAFVRPEAEDGLDYSWSVRMKQYTAAGPGFESREERCFPSTEQGRFGRFGRFLTQDWDSHDTRFHHHQSCRPLALAARSFDWPPVHSLSSSIC
jgi:hypothetical protein